MAWPFISAGAHAPHSDETLGPTPTRGSSLSARRLRSLAFLCSSKDRMDITGARWGLERAEAILKLRSLKVSGDLAAYRAFHFEQEHKRHYPGPPIPLAEREAA